MQTKYTITILAENEPGVLYRMSDLFLRRKINLDSLTVSESEQPNISRFTLVVRGDKIKIEQTVKQLYRIIEIVKAYESQDHDLIFKELAFIKVSTKNANSRREVSDIVTLSQGKIEHVGKDYLVVEKSGTEEQIDTLYELLKPFGIKEFVRSGRIAVLKTPAD
ncbi:acetolactate synthase small subunit [Candidatus Roizmanbacteria bacterium]|nr:acetolactate synthase small subunit [Candidatus Roizmanbacteria bacterium]